MALSALLFSVLSLLPCKSFPIFRDTDSDILDRLYGVTSVQAFLYFSDCKQDGRWLRGMVRGFHIQKRSLSLRNREGVVSVVRGLVRNLLYLSISLT